MFTVINLDNFSYLIVKKDEIPEKNFLKANNFPLKVYGFIFKKISKDTVTFRIITNETLSEEDERSLFIEALDERRPLFKGKL